jgi:uncharacterized protein YggE
MDEARRLAVADARTKAELYAEAAGVTLGDLVTLNEGGGGSSGPFMAEMSMARSAVPVAAGELDVSATVNVVYSIAE